MPASIVRALVLMLLFVLVSAGASAAEAVDLRLVLASDVSRSVNDEEFDLQRKGYAQAFRDQRVFKAIKSGRLGRIAVCFVEWASADSQQTVIEWTVIGDEESAGAFADALEAKPRAYYGRTAIGAAIDYSVQETERSNIPSERRVIDVSGDGTNNDGRPVTMARDDAVKSGYTINGLAILNTRVVLYNPEHTNPPGGIENYYRENVIGGPGAFVLMIEGFQSFAEAMTNKLILEIAASPEQGLRMLAERLR